VRRITLRPGAQQTRAWTWPTANACTHHYSSAQHRTHAAPACPGVNRTHTQLSTAHAPGQRLWLLRRLIHVHGLCAWAILHWSSLLHCKALRVEGRAMQGLEQLRATMRVRQEDNMPPGMCYPQCMNRVGWGTVPSQGEAPTRPHSVLAAHCFLLQQ